MAAVGSVNESNAGITTGGVVVGAAAGAGSAYYMKPYLKEGLASDKFVKAVAEGLEGEAKTAFENIAKVKPEVSAYLNELKAVEKLPEGEALKAFKDTIVSKFKNLGYEGDALTSEINNIASKEQLTSFVENVTKAAEGGAQKSAVDSFIKDGKIAFEEANKTLGEGIQKIAKSFQLKTALKWGAIGAAVLGVVTYLLTSGSKKEA